MSSAHLFYYCPCILKIDERTEMMGMIDMMKNKRTSLLQFTQRVWQSEILRKTAYEAVCLVLFTCVPLSLWNDFKISWRQFFFIKGNISQKLKSGELKSWLFWTIQSTISLKIVMYRHYTTLKGPFTEITQNFPFYCSGTLIRR